MAVTVNRATNDAFKHTKRILFKPFNFEKWLTLGLCAFLIGIGDCSNNNSGINWNTRGWPGRGGTGLAPATGINVNPNATTPGAVPPVANFDPTATPSIPVGGSEVTVPSTTTVTTIQTTTANHWFSFTDSPEFQNLLYHFKHHIPEILLYAALGLIGVGLLYLLLLWLSSRGYFMLLYGAQHNRPAVPTPWREYRSEGNSLMGFRFMVTAFAMAGSILLIVLCVTIAWPNIQTETWGTNATIALTIYIVIFFPAAVVFSIVDQLLKDFVVPTMYLKRVPVLSGWSIAWQKLIKPRGYSVVGFYAFKILLAIGAGMITAILVMMTCCIGALPFVSSVLTLPLLLFLRLYSICYIQQIGTEWRFFPIQGPTGFCDACGYNLTGNLTGVCPECGTFTSTPAFGHADLPAPPTTPPSTPPIG